MNIAEIAADAAKSDGRANTPVADRVTIHFKKPVDSASYDLRARQLTKDLIWGVNPVLQGDNGSGGGDMRL